MEWINAWVVGASDWVWSYLVIGLSLFAGIYCTVRLGFIQIRSLPHCFQLIRGRYNEGSGSNDISTLQALATTLASTTGIGNIAGVAVAISLGGPGAIFWMWVMAFLGMSLKFAEATLGSMYRTKEKGVHNGALVGGPMYYLAEGLGPKWKPVALSYAVLGSISFLGAWNMFQANQATAIFEDQFSVAPWITALVLAFFSGLVLIGGIHRIGQVASRVVPTMCLVYLCGVAVILVMNYDKVPTALSLIFYEAFNFDAASGGTIATVIMIGIRRAMFSNEVGAGSAAIAFAAAHSKHPVRQGVVASVGPFIDTIVVCTATALVILIAGFYGAERYQPANLPNLSFEAQDSFKSSSVSWALTNKFPATWHPLQTLTDGKSVLATNSIEAVTLTLPTLDIEEATAPEALRLSIHSDVSLNAKIVDKRGKERSQIHIKPGNDWQSVLMHLASNPGFNAEPLTLVLTPANSGAVFMDRVQWVNEANGIVLSSAAFQQLLGAFGSIFVPLAALLFAYTSILAGSYYGEVCSQYLSGRFLIPYKWLYVFSIVLGGVVNLDLIINFSDLALGLACIPNLIALILLCPKVSTAEKVYFREIRTDAPATTQEV